MPAPTLSEMTSTTVRLAGAFVATTAAALAVSRNLYRVIDDGLHISDDVKQWAHVTKHEERFRQALSAGTAAEDQDEN